MSEAGHASRRSACAARPCRAARRWCRAGRRCGRLRRRSGDLRHGVAQHAGGDRVALGVVGVEEALRRGPVDHLGQLPAQVHRILHAGVEALPADRGVHVRGVAGQQHAPVAVGRRLPGHVGEPGDPGRAVDAVIGAVDGDERLAEIAQGGLAGAARRAAASVTERPAPGPSVRPADEAMDGPTSSRRSPQLRLLGQLDLGDQAAGRRIPPGELDAGRLADQAAAAVAPDEVVRPQRRAVGQLDVDAGVVLREAGHLAPAVRSAPRARRPSRPGCARCGSATARARRGGGWGSR